MDSHVEFVRRIYEEDLFDRNIEPILERCHPDVEYVNPAEAVEAGTRRGLDRLRVLAAASAELFAWSDHVLQRLYADDKTVVAAVTFRARGQESGMELEQAEVHSWTFRAGHIVRFEWGRDLPAALAAAGLPEETGS